MFHVKHSSVFIKEYVIATDIIYEYTYYEGDLVTIDMFIKDNHIFLLVE